MDNTTHLPPHVLKQFAQLADYLGKAQRVATELSLSQSIDFNNFLVDLTPPEVTPEEDSWFWSEEWQAGEREVNKNIAKGEVSSFDSVEELIADLNS